MDFETKAEAARKVWVWSGQLANSAAIAQTQIAAGSYQEAVVTIPAAALRLQSEVVRLQAKGWGADVLGPVIFDLVDGDPARSWVGDYSADYEAFKVSLFEYVAIVLGASPWSFNLDSATGALKYNVEPSQSVKDSLNAKLAEIVANFPIPGS